MKDENCESCDKAKYGYAYIDEESGILCVGIDTGRLMPKGKKVLAPLICTDCGTTEWKTFEN